MKQTYHNAPTAGHQGRSKTIRRIREQFYWDGMSADIKAYVRACLVCQLTKPRQHQPYRTLAPLPVPTQPFQEISMDFITGLPPSISVHGPACNAVLVVVDRLTKYAVDLETRTSLTAH